jgi:hypothetical protein
LSNFINGYVLSLVAGPNNSIDCFIAGLNTTLSYSSKSLKGTILIAIFLGFQSLVACHNKPFLRFIAFVNTT